MLELALLAHAAGEDCAASFLLFVLEWKWYFASVSFPRAVGEGHVVLLPQGLSPAAQRSARAAPAVARS